MLKIEPIPAFDDNYIWLLRNPAGSSAVVVDPGDDDPVLARLQADGLQLVAILITHKHGDHVGGIAALTAKFPAVKVYGPAGEPIRGLTHPLRDGQRVSIAELGAEFEVFDVPGHTEGHLAYFGEGVLFCGDTLFAGGCGRVFSGTHAQLHASLERIAGLPPETLVYCAHEYTLANLGFAVWVEPESEAIRKRLAGDRAARERGEPTVPSTLMLERATNPFMRSGVAEVIAAASRWAGHPLEDGTAVFTALRTWKDREYDR